ncbi:hypothetical protein P7K49_040513, partial [Saguinus oedipus]
ENPSRKTDGALLPGNLRSGFLLESATSGSAFSELQTPVSRGTGPVYCARRAAMPRQRQNCCAGHRSRAGDPRGSATGNLLVRGRRKFL